jgi:hypothetical protein
VLVVDRRMAVRRIHWTGNCFWGDRDFPLHLTMSEI